MVLAVSQGACAGSPGPVPRPSHEVPPAEHDALPVSGSVDAGPFAESYFGESVLDPYHWLETADPTVETWLEQQGEAAVRTISSIAGVAELRARITELLVEGDTISAVTASGDRVFYLRRRKGEQTASLYFRDQRSGERLLFRATSPDQEVDNIAPSRDGRYVAFSVGSGGAEDNTVQVIDVTTRKLLSDHLEHLNVPGITWLSSPSGNAPYAFYYSRYPHFADGDDKTRYRDAVALVHRLGTPVRDDVRIVAKEVPGSPPLDEIAFPEVTAVPGSPFEIATIRRGVESSVTLYSRRATRDGHATWQKLVDGADHVIDWAVHETDLFVLTTTEAAGTHVGVIDLRAPSTARPFAEITDGRVPSTIAVSSEGLYIVEGDVRGSFLRRIAFGTRRDDFIPLPFEGSVTSIVTDPTSPRVLLQVEGWCHSEQWLEQANIHASPVTAFADVKVRSVEGEKIEHVEVSSRDGTRVPMTILSKENAPRDGSSPTVLLGYGAYGVSIQPSYGPSRVAWLERGGTVAIAHVRGGGELGRAWHEAGMREHRQNAIDDFIACGEYLVRSGYTTPARLAAAGESAGGLLVAMAAMQRPELFRAISVNGGMVNLLQLMSTTIGPANAEEFGAPDTIEGVRTLLSMDAYHQVRDGVRYPAVLVSVGMKDARVPYWQGAKFAARLQDASSSGRPVLLNMDRDAGHAEDSIKYDANYLAIRYAFFLWQMGVPWVGSDRTRDGG
jgi:prolyl oligopeptidase